MNKNNIFNSLLIDSLFDDNFENDIFENEIISDTNNKCLISDEKLNEKHITLKCKHKFNYDSIFYEVKKRKCNITRYNSTKIKRWSIQCPYCRNIQTGILPYEDGYPKLEYVNWPIRHSFNASTCEYIFKKGKNVGKLCGKICLGTHCKIHLKYKKNPSEISKQIPILYKKQIYALCEHVLSRGQNKGNVCNKKVILHKFKKNESTDNINLNNYKYKKYYCKCHQKLYGELEKLNN